MSMTKAFYVKNVPGWERALRVLLSLAAVAFALTSLPRPWDWVVAVSAIGVAATGLVGFCPMCALVGRKLDRAANG